MTTQPKSRLGKVHQGWYLLALAGELTEEITPLRIGSRALIAVRADDRVRVFDGICPHRGASLGHGGELLPGPAVRCPFHGRRIGLGDGVGAGRWSVRELPSVDAGGAVFVRLTDAPDGDRGFGLVLKTVLASRRIVPACTVQVSVPAEYVIENAFDLDHFPSVHLVSRVVGQSFGLGDEGELGISTEFVTHAPPWERSADGSYRSRFHARAFSPSLVVTELGQPGLAHYVFTGATAVSGTSCVVRIAFGVEPDTSAAVLDELISGARRAIEQDRAVWEHLDLDAPVSLAGRDASVLAFQHFCAGFGALSR
ncbi:MAG: Rieske 2Fe-2S domain-containing protein [Actinomycetota bacterium]|nr:Rieske 2Fe-2S domain-containing protein [Actinomycetota bacterium]